MAVWDFLTPITPGMGEITFWNIRGKMPFSTFDLLASIQSVISSSFRYRSWRFLKDRSSVLKVTVARKHMAMFIRPVPSSTIWSTAWSFSWSAEWSSCAMERCLQGLCGVHVHTTINFIVDHYINVFQRKGQQPVLDALQSKLALIKKFKPSGQSQKLIGVYPGFKVTL